MKSSTELKTHGEVLADEFSQDDAFREEWDRTALARAVAAKVIEYRVDHDLTQTALARALGMRQPHVARLEAGEHNPSIEKLVLLSEKLGIEFAIDIAPSASKPKLVTKAAQASGQMETARRGEVSVLLATT